MTQPPLAKIVRIVNTAVALALAVVLALFYWYGWRPLPRRSGTIESGVDASVFVRFDTLGVPHISAASEEDALFVQGYVTAQDRLWQMDALRRYAGGDLAEILGTAGLESDRESRRMRLRRIAEQAYTVLPPADRAVLAAYARGVNQFLATHRDNLPLEFTLLGYQPRPWSAIDCMLISLHMFRTLTTTWRDEVVKRAMLAEGDAAKVNFLFPVRAEGDGQPGSNAWAIAGSRTASGKPILSNDMHLEYSLPGIWYMAHLTAPSLDVSGVTIPGVPGVVVGHNQRIAWGITSLQVDVQDLYVETFDDRTGRYLYRGQVEQARAEREIIRVKGQAANELAVWVTRHGPIFLAEGKERMALRWTAAEPGILQFPLLEIDRAQNWQQFTTALSRWGGPGSNFVYADVDGNIGYHAAGKLPIRRGYQGDLPADGAKGDCEWDGFIPFDQLPAVFNPPGGMIATANQNPFPANYPFPVNGNFASPYRVRQIRDLLSAHNGWRPGDLLAVQKDVYSSQYRFLADQVVAAYEKRQGHNATLETAVSLLRAWNGQMEQDQAAPLLMALIYLQVRTAAAESAAPGKGDSYQFTMAPSVVEELLLRRPQGWFRDYDEMLLRALADAVEEGTRMQGRSIRHWQYGAYLKVEIRHPVFGHIPVIGKYFDIGPVAMSGSGTTVKQTSQRLAPSMRMNADLGDWDRSLLNIPIGESGQPLSGHYKDEWSAYYNGRSYPMAFRAVQAKSTLEFRPAK
ncbi:MAG: penicillin acylase family protein [Acidobacteriia bacterium]|nr:penicillin acylase family protein [Terriglobia bacterium]